LATVFTKPVKEMGMNQKSAGEFFQGRMSIVCLAAGRRMVPGTDLAQAGWRFQTIPSTAQEIKPVTPSGDSAYGHRS